MQLITLLLLPLLVAAEQQPLSAAKDMAAAWFDKAKAYMETGIPSPIDAGASKVADSVVEKINKRNWQRKLAPKLEGPEDWLILFTGGNKTCYGHCDSVNQAWNISVPLISALPSSPRLGAINCEKDDVLCTAWAAAVPSAWYMEFPQKPLDPSISTPPTPLYIVPVNWTNVTPQDFVKIVSEKSYLSEERYTGVLHPIDGIFAKAGLLLPLGYFLWGLGSTPSWLVMVGVSFISRQYMSRRAAARTPFSADRPPVEPPRAAARPAGAGQAGGRKKKN